MLVQILEKSQSIVSRLICASFSFDKITSTCIPAGIRESIMLTSPP